MKAERSRKKYSNISVEQRKKLIEIVQRNQHTFKEAARLCGIKRTTARSIYEKYEKTQCFSKDKAPEKIRRDEEPEKIEENPI